MALLYILATLLLLTSHLSGTGKSDSSVEQRSSGGVSGWLTPASVMVRSFSFVPNTIVFRRSSPRSLIIALLLLGCVEEHPGPTVNTTGLHCGVLNVRSCVNKAASIHDVISSSHLDILALTETHIAANSPAAILNDVAPQGYSVIHSPRVGRKKRGGGGIAVIYRTDLDCKIVKDSSLNVSSCESLCVRVVNRSQRINLLVVYRPPPRAASVFFDELSNLMDTVASLPGEFVICGDFNTPGNDSTHVDDRLVDMLQDVGFTQHVTQPTRSDGKSSNLLDLVITDDGSAVDLRDLVVTSMPFSDHSLVSFGVDFVTSNSNTSTFHYRSLSNIDTYRFIDIMRSSKICTSPPCFVNDFAKQLDADVTAALDVVAPLRTRTKRVSPRQTPAWMTTAVKDLKRHSRQLERRFRATGKESDYVAWRRAGRLVVRETNEARRGYYKERIAAAGSQPAQLWRVVKDLLHSVSAITHLDSVTAKSRADSFLVYFTTKIEKTRCEIQSML